MSLDKAREFDMLAASTLSPFCGVRARSAPFRRRSHARFSLAIAADRGPPIKRSWPFWNGSSRATHARNRLSDGSPGHARASVIANIERVPNHAAPGEGRDELTPTEREIRFRNEKSRASRFVGMPRIFPLRQSSGHHCSFADSEINRVA